VKISFINSPPEDLAPRKRENRRGAELNVEGIKEASRLKKRFRQRKKSFKKQRWNRKLCEEKGEDILKLLAKHLFGSHSQTTQVMTRSSSQSTARGPKMKIANT